jgi:hypothetical protein
MINFPLQSEFHILPYKTGTGYAVYYWPTNKQLMSRGYWVNTKEVALWYEYNIFGSLNKKIYHIK